MLWPSEGRLAMTRPQARALKAAQAGMPSARAAGVGRSRVRPAKKEKEKRGKARGAREAGLRGAIGGMARRRGGGAGLASAPRPAPPPPAALCLSALGERPLVSKEEPWGCWGSAGGGGRRAWR